LCGRELSESTFMALGYDDLPYRVAARLGDGFLVSPEAMRATTAAGDALVAGNWEQACISAAVACDELHRTRMGTLAGGGL
jgi:hypothetical protein